jgi:hypothetical protein
LVCERHCLGCCDEVWNFPGVILRVCTDVQCVASVACGGFQFIVMMDGCDGTYTVAGVEHIAAALTFVGLVYADLCQFYVLSTEDGTCGRQCWDTAGRHVLLGFGFWFVPGDSYFVHRVPFQLEPVSHDGWDARLVRLAAARVAPGLLEWAVGKLLLEKSRPLVAMVALGLDFADYFQLTGCESGTLLLSGVRFRPAQPP